MSGFHERFGPAQEWEHRLIHQLCSRGWLAAPFGQAQIPEAMRPHLSRWLDDYGRETLLRWTPDIITVRPTRTPYVCLIDAKTEKAKNRDGPNYSVEVSAVSAGQAIVRDWHMPLYYVWEDGKVLTPTIVENRWHRKLDGVGANGSGTAFYLVAKKFATPAGQIFVDINQEATA